MGFNEREAEIEKLEQTLGDLQRMRDRHSTVEIRQGYEAVAKDVENLLTLLLAKP